MIFVLFESLTVLVFNQCTLLCCYFYFAAIACNCNLAVWGDVFPVGACRRYARPSGAVPIGRLVAMATAQARERGSRCSMFS